MGFRYDGFNFAAQENFPSKQHDWLRIACAHVGSWKRKCSLKQMRICFNDPHQPFGGVLLRSRILFVHAFLSPDPGFILLLFLSIFEEIIINMYLVYFWWRRGGVAVELYPYLPTCIGYPYLFGKWVLISISISAWDLGTHIHIHIFSRVHNNPSS